MHSTEKDLLSGPDPPSLEYPRSQVNVAISNDFRINLEVNWSRRGSSSESIFTPSM
jgi:hypothetical protein